MEYPFKDLLPLDEVLAREGYYKDWTHLDPEVFYSLTQISEYIKTKGYGVDVRLLIAQLAEHFGLKTTQVVDLANSLSTKHDALKDQFDEVIRDATSGADWGGEIVLARGGKPTLQARLDETTAQLAQIPKQYPVLNIMDFGADNTGQEDISQILDTIMFEYSSAEIKFPKGEYLIDIDIAQGEIGNSYTDTFIFSGNGNDSVIKINSFKGTHAFGFKGEVKLYNLMIDGMVDGVNTLNKVLWPYLMGVTHMENCYIKNMNGNLEFHPTKRVVIKNNTFDYSVDHAIYVRKTVKTLNTKQELIIEGNIFIGTGDYRDYHGGSASNPRDPIKIVGRLNRVIIKNNYFIGTNGAIGIQDNDIQSTLPRYTLIEGNTFATGYDSIRLTGVQSSLNEYAEIEILKNKFLSGSELNLEGYNLVNPSFINIQRHFYCSSLIIKGNSFKGVQDADIKAIECQDGSTTDVRKFSLEDNDFDNLQLFLRNTKGVIQGNTIKNVLNFINTNDTEQIFKGNTVINTSKLFQIPPGWNAPSFLISKNTFIDCEYLVKASSVHVGFIWIENTFKNVSTIFDTTLAESLNIAHAFMFLNNVLINTNVISDPVTPLPSKISQFPNYQLIGNNWNPLS